MVLLPFGGRRYHAAEERNRERNRFARAEVSSTGGGLWRHKDRTRLVSTG
jgi:hypothetical protein